MHGATPEQRIPNDESAPDRQAGSFWPFLTAAVLVGAALRLFGVGRQVLTGDELHTVNGALARSVGEILRTWTYHGADYCVPLTAFFRLLMDRGLVLSETTLRAPALIASILTIATVPPLLRSRIGRGPALLLAGLLAISPMLVLYGRMVRSYAPMVLLATLAVLAFDRWWRQRSPSAAAAYVLLCALATWLHLGAAPFVLSPFLFAAGMLIRRPGDLSSSMLPLLALAAATAAAMALPLLPALGSLMELMELHGRGSLPPPGIWLEVAHLQVGSRSTLVVAAASAAAVRGALLLWRRDRDFMLLLGALAVGQLVGLVILAPNFLQALVVANRYVLILLPLGLALVALGLASPLRRDRREAGRGLRWAHGAAVAGLVAALFASGPLASREFAWSSFTHAQPFLNFIKPGDSIPRQRVPAFYKELPPGSEAILEAPWTNVGTHSFNAYQHVHQRPLRVASLNRAHSDERLSLRNTIPARPDEMKASGARYVVVHIDLREEEHHVTTSELRHHERLARLPELWRVLHVGGTRLATQLRESWGAPVYSDASIRVWDLASEEVSSR